MKNLKPHYVALGLIGLGFVFILIGWNGAAGQSCVDCQVPYLLSGGFGGLAFVVVGGGLLLFESGRRARAHLEQKLDELIDLLRSGGGETPDKAAPTATVAPRSPDGMVVVGRTSFHRPDCRLAVGKEGMDFAPAAEAVARGLTPCRVCDPTRVAR
jgi:hypothetical protein